MATALEFVPPRDALNTTTYYNYYQDFFIRSPYKKENMDHQKTLVDFEPIWSIHPGDLWYNMTNRLGEMIISIQRMVKDKMWSWDELLHANGLVYLGIGIMILSFIIWFCSFILRLRIHPKNSNDNKQKDDK